MTQLYSRNRIARIFSVIILLLTSAVLLIKPALRLVYPYKYADKIKSVSNQCGIDEFLIAGIISAESGFDQSAVSHKGAKGLMQIKDETAKWCVEKFNIDETMDPTLLNITTGCTYLGYLIDKYGGNVDTAIAAYNAGEGNVTKWLKNQETVDSALYHIPFAETERYLRTVRNREKIYRFIYG